MESLHTQSTEAAEVPTFRKTPGGVVESRPTTPASSSPDATANKITPDRSGALSDAEKLRLAKIRRDRNAGWMATFEDFDWLLSKVEELSR
jgi:hypothetical protein